MKILGWILLAAFAVGLAVAGCVALVNDEDSMPVVQTASHEYDGYNDECWGEECGYGSDYSQDYSGRDRNRNRGRNRGAFSPGPFDDSPVDAFNGNTICLPGSTCNIDDRRRDEEPPPEERPV